MIPRFVFGWMKKKVDVVESEKLILRNLFY